MYPEATQNQPAKHLENIVPIVCLLILGAAVIGYFLYSSSSKKEIETSSYSECGKIVTMTTIGQGVVGKGDNEQLCAYNFTVGRWVKPTVMDDAATSTGR